MSGKAQGIVRDARWLGDEAGRPGADALHDAIDRLYRPGPGAAAEAAAQQALRRKLQARLRERLYYGEVRGTPFGTVYLAVSERGVAAVGLAIRERAFVERLHARTGLDLVHSEERVAGAARQLQGYLEGRLEAFSLPVDLRAVPSFQRRVLEEAARVPRGRVATYGNIAARLGKPRASRAVGQALAHNPVPILIPCHRVLAADGSLGGYLGGRTRWKARLLALEGVGA